MVFALTGGSTKQRLCGRWVPVGVLFLILLVGGVADGAILDTAKVRVVASGTGASVHIAGSATIPASVTNAPQRRAAASTRAQRPVVRFSLTGGGHSERFAVSLERRHGYNRYPFAVTHVTKLTGALRLQARVSDDGQPVGVASTIVNVQKPQSGAPSTGSGTGSSLAPETPPPTPEREQPYVLPCAEPVLPTLEPGMGILTGSFHLGGGPAPGEYVCAGATVTVTTLAGEVVATKEVGGTESYAIALPAGTYLVNAVATSVIVNGEPAMFLKNRETNVAAGSTKEIPVEYGIP